MVWKMWVWVILRKWQKMWSDGAQKQLFQIIFKMKYSTSKEKLSQIHEELDRQLELASAVPRSSLGSRKDKEEFRYHSNLDEPKRTNAHKPVTFDHNVKETDIRTKKHEINELERKLMDLENKLNNCGNESDDDDEEVQPVKASIPTRAGLAFKERAESTGNQDTARFLINQANKEKERERGKYQYSYPSLEDEEEEEDSEDYEEMQRAVEKKKQEAREQSIKRTVNVLTGLGNKPTAVELRRDRSTDRKISTEAETVLKPKYPNDKKSVGNKSRLSQQGKNSIRNSTTSKKSQQKNQPTLNRANSKRSVKSINSARSKNHSNPKNDRSFDRFSEKNEEALLHNEEVDLAKDLKKMSNLQKQLTHYKRLARKYKQQLEDYRIMQIQFKEMKKNFAKSELIRTQQKKVIETLKNKMGK